MRPTRTHSVTGACPGLRLPGSREDWFHPLGAILSVTLPSTNEAAEKTINFKIFKFSNPGGDLRKSRKKSTAPVIEGALCERFWLRTSFAFT